MKISLSTIGCIRISSVRISIDPVFQAYGYSEREILNKSNYSFSYIPIEIPIHRIGFSEDRT